VAAVRGSLAPAGGRRAGVGTTIADNAAVAERADTAVVRAIRPGETQLLRELRLRALTQAPEAFAATVADEAARESADWEQLASGGEDHVVLVAEQDEGRPAGMAGGRWFDRERGIAQLWGLWVDPTARGGGTGAALVRAVNEWAAGRGARFVRLGVIDPGGQGATAFYRRLGFVALDDPVPMRTDPSRLVTYMIRPV
jgi:GNAT superfamily N-acetyltransferase